MNAANASIIGQQVGGKFKFKYGNIRKGFCFGVQGAEDLASSGIPVRMQDAITAVCAFTSESQLRTVAIKFRAPFNQFFNSLRAFFHQHLDRICVAESVSRIQRVL